MKRSGVRTRVLGLAWEERFLAAVAKARERKLIAGEQAERLRRFAGVYFCSKCRKEHRTESAQGKAHLRYEPRPEAKPPPKGEAGPAPARAQVGARSGRAKGQGRKDRKRSKEDKDRNDRKNPGERKDRGRR